MFDFKKEIQDNKERWEKITNQCQKIELEVVLCENDDKRDINDLVIANSKLLLMLVEQLKPLNAGELEKDIANLLQNFSGGSNAK
jgi:hypothetical protein